MGHSYTNILEHIVCGTKYRLPHITTDRRERLDAYIGGVLRTHGCQLLAAGGMPDHSHWLIRMHPSRATADIVRELKAQSSGWFRDTFESTFKWQCGYGVFSVSASGTDAVREYIAGQAEHHRTMSFQDEFEAFLRKNNIPYKPEYLWRDADADEDE